MKVYVADPAEKQKATCLLSMKQNCQVPFQKGGRGWLVFLMSSLNAPSLVFVSKFSGSPRVSHSLGSDAGACTHYGQLM